MVNMVCLYPKRTDNYEIYRVELANKKLINLTNNKADEDDPSYSPDGNWISFTADNALMKMKADGSMRTKLFDGDHGYSSFSKNGQFIAFARINGNSATLYYCKTDGSDLRQITDDAIRYSSISWSPDNQQIVYLNKNEKITTITIDGSRKNVVRNGYDPSWSY